MIHTTNAIEAVNQQRGPRIAKDAFNEFSISYDNELSFESFCCAYTV